MEHAKPSSPRNQGSNIPTPWTQPRSSSASLQSKKLRRPRSNKSSGSSSLEDSNDPQPLEEPGSPSNSSVVDSLEDDNIRVLIRIRPPTDQGDLSTSCIKLSKDRKSLTIGPSANPDRRFMFDSVFDEKSSQDDIFQEAGKFVVENALKGYNGSIFVYGQTGSGKTHTMQGDCNSEEYADNTDRGLMPRIFDYIFLSLEKQDEEAPSMASTRCWCSYLEIYNEKVFDLLESGAEHPKAIREDQNYGIHVQGLREEPISNAEEAIELLITGSQNRRVAVTNMNRESSRSHSVFNFRLERKLMQKDGIEITRRSELNLIDLAGSERQEHTNTTGDRLKEASQINKSLSALGNVIMALVEVSQGQKRHVHYRDSKLTFLLRDSLGGSAKTTIIATVSPAEKWFGETLSTLKFAQRAKHIKNKAVVNEETDGTVAMLKLEISNLRKQLLLSAKTNGDNEKILQLEEENASFRDGQSNILDFFTAVELTLEGRQTGFDDSKGEHRTTLEKINQYTANKNNQIQRLEQKIRSLQNDLASSQLACDFNEAQFIQMKETLEIRQSDFDIQESELRELKYLLEKKIDAEGRWEEDQNRLKLEIRTLRQQLDASNAPLGADGIHENRQLIELHTKYAILEEKLRESDETCRTLHDQVERLTKNARCLIESEYRTEIDQLKKALENKALDCSNLETRLQLAHCTDETAVGREKPIEDQTVDQVNEIAILNAEVESYRNQLRNKESINDCLMDSVKDEQLRIDALVEEVTRLEREKAELQKHNRRLSTEAEKHSTELPAYDSRIDLDDKGQSREKLLDERNTAVTRERQWQDKAEELKYQFRSQSEELARLVQQSGALTSAKLYLQHSLDNALVDNAELLQTLRKLQSDKKMALEAQIIAKQTISSLEAKMHLLQRETHETKSLLAELSSVSRNTGSGNMYAKRNEEMKQLAAEKVALNSRLRATQYKLQVAEQELNKLKGKTDGNRRWSTNTAPGSLGASSDCNESETGFLGDSEFEANQAIASMSQKIRSLALDLFSEQQIGKEISSFKGADVWSYLLSKIEDKINDFKILIDDKNLVIKLLQKEINLTKQRADSRNIDQIPEGEPAESKTMVLKLPARSGNTGQQIVRHNRAVSIDSAEKFWPKAT